MHCEDTTRLFTLLQSFNPREASLELTFNTNVQGAWTVMQAAEEVGIKRIVVASSDSVFGLSYNPPEWKPRFLPVDETHATRPTEVYSLKESNRSHSRELSLLPEYGSYLYPSLSYNFSKGI